MNELKELTIFDYLEQVFITKKNNIINDGDNFPYYMIQRWGTMHSPQLALLLNQWCNPYYRSMEDSRMQYDFVKSITPKLKNSKWKYIKKTEREKTKEKQKYTKEDIGTLCKYLEMSRKDVLLLLENDWETFSKLIEGTQILKGRKLEQ